MKFTVLMSIYNKETPEHLSQCLNSIFNQTIQPSEIIIVEDGPLNDGLYDELTKWESKLPITRVALQKNSGLGVALNVGLSHCSFKLVARMDTDDICLPDRFEKQLNVFDNQDVDVCGSWISEFENEPDLITAIRTLPESHKDLSSYSKFKNPINHPSVMFRLDKIVNVGGYEDVRFFEDYYLWLKLLDSGSKFYNIQEPLVNMRAGVSQLTRRSGLSYARDEYKFLYKSWNKGFFTFFQFSKCCIFRVPARVLPKNILAKIYLLNRNTAF
ncbi:glycosyltransferase [Shewanella aegiceratis]|uniref:glycosyltransferase n=1 Tax=Shewanella aegiceratis TaxID=2864203 RepID=UPI001C65CB3A|nr:glycosyltransferase [Shewanella aegiceratis]QYJ83761.1 glycosyltransferase [Shewanella aegiceratis]